MTLTLDIEPALRSARIREAAALAAGDVVSPLFLSGIVGFDPATLSLTLHRDASMARKVAEVQAGSFSPVPGHPSLARAELRLDATEMEDWFLAAAGQESSSADMSDDAAEDAVRADGWLVVADASRTWAACRIPVVLRDFVGRGTLSGDSVSAVAAAAALAAVEEALSGKADLVGGVVPSSQLPEGPAPSVVSAASLAEFPAEGAAGTLYVDTAARRIYVWDGTSYAEVSPSAVTSVNGATGDVSVPPQVQADWSEDSESSPSFVRNKPDLSVLSGPVADWNETDAGSPRHIANKPDLGALARAAQADWTEESEGSPAYIANKPSAEELQADWNESDSSKPSYVQGKPTAAQLQADWAETDSTSPKFIDHKPDGTAWQADWLEESEGSPNRIRNRPTASDLQADWEESDSTKPSYVRNRPAAADMQADWAESDTGSPSYVRNRPSAFDRQADWAETDSSRPSYVRNKPAAGATIAEVERAVAAAVAGKQDALGDAALAAVSSGITAEKVLYFQRIAAIALGGGSAGYPFVDAAVTHERSGWTFGTPLIPGVALAGPVPVQTVSGWSLFPYEAAAHGSPESGIDTGWEIEESESAASATLSVPRSRTGGYDLHVFDDVVTLDPLPASSPYGSAKAGFVRSTGTVDWYSDSNRAILRSRSLSDGTVVWYATISLSQRVLCTEEYLSLEELVAAMESGLPSGMYSATGSGESPVFEDGSGPTFRTVSSASVSDVVEVAPWTVAALVPDPDRPLRVVPGPLPDGVSGVQRDMFLVLDCEGLSEAPAVSWDPSVDLLDGDVVPVAGEVAVLRMTEYAPGRFTVRRAGAQVQADWSESDSTDPAFVRNRPDVVTKGFLLSGGKISSSLLPSYVDDVVEYSGVASFPAEGESGKIYVDVASGRTYRWSGTQYAEIAASPVTSVNGQTGDVTLVIPSVDSALSPTSENPVQNKVVSKALYTGFTEWVCDEISDGYEYRACEWTADTSGIGWYVTIRNQTSHSSLRRYVGGAVDAVGLETPSTDPIQFRLSRHLVTPTKTSQLANDGPSSGPNVGHPFATTNQIPAPVDISGKLDGAAAYPAWNESVHYPAGTTVSHNGRLWHTNDELIIGGTTVETPNDDAEEWYETTLDDLKQDALSTDQLAAVNSGATAAKVATWDGYAAQIAAKANAADLPYALVTPGEWEFSGLPSGFSANYIEYADNLGEWVFTFTDGVDGFDVNVPGLDTDTSLSFYVSGNSVTATRASLPGHLLDRAGNRVVVSGDTTLTLPALVNAGKLRDFLVRLEISGSTVPTITFAGPTGETLTYETDGDEFPAPDEAGTWLYSFTETAAGVFVVALKSVSVVTQGGE